MICALRCGMFSRHHRYASCHYATFMYSAQQLTHTISAYVCTIYKFCRVCLLLMKFTVFTITSAVQVIVSRHVRDDVLKLIVRIFGELDGLAPQDRVLQCQSLMTLEQPEQVAEILSKLVESGDEKSYLLALQIAFDLFDNDVYVRQPPLTFSFNDCVFCVYTVPCRARPQLVECLWNANCWTLMHRLDCDTGFRCMSQVPCSTFYLGV